MNAVNDVYKYAEFIMGGKNFFCDRHKKIGYRFYHSKLVTNLCIYILDHVSECDIPAADRKEMMLRKECICIAALLHDIKKDEKSHAEKAAASLCDIFKAVSKYTGSTEILNISADNILIIEEMIRKHGSHGSDDEHTKYYIRLIQDADNLSRYESYMPKEVFYNVFNIRNEKEKYLAPKEKIKEKHKKLNYIESKKILNLI